MNPLSLLGISWDLGIGRAAMSLDQSPLATSSGYARVGGQYITAAAQVAIVGWLFRESAGRLACTDRSLQ